MRDLFEVVEKTKALFAALLREVAVRGGMSPESYLRYLSFEYHLCAEMERHHFDLSGHASLARHEHLCGLLHKKSIEEQARHSVALADFARIPANPLPCPIDVTLWKSYFGSANDHRPQVKIGALCILENLKTPERGLGPTLLREAKFPEARESRFLAGRFRQSNVPGPEITSALLSADLSPTEIEEVIEGANVAAVLYLRMVSWATMNDPLVSLHFDTSYRSARNQRHGAGLPSDGLFSR